MIILSQNETTRERMFANIAFDNLKQLMRVGLVKVTDVIQPDGSWRAITESIGLIRQVDITESHLINPTTRQIIFQPRKVKKENEIPAEGLATFEGQVYENGGVVDYRPCYSYIKTLTSAEVDVSGTIYDGMAGFVESVLQVNASLFL